MTIEQWGWVLFHVFIVTVLILDLGVFHRGGREVRIRESLIWTGIWMSLALGFAGLIAWWHDEATALQFLTGYVIEQSLSVDNLFVFLVVFQYFQVPAHQQHRVLFWGIIGALLMRLLFILAGVLLIARFHWLIYVFGGILIITAFRLLVQQETKFNPARNPVLRLFRWMHVPITEGYEGNRFFVRRDGMLWATPLFVVLLVIETTDVVFAVDSIPAILAISKDPFIVYTSNVFAILGLRSLYFALAGMMRLFHYLHYGLAVVLGFVGVKMLLSDTEYEVPIGITLAVVVGVLSASVALSLLFPPRKPAHEDQLPAAQGTASAARPPASEAIRPKTP